MASLIHRWPLTVNANDTGAGESATGNVNLLINAPSILAPIIRIDCYLTGVVTLEKICCYADV